MIFDRTILNRKPAFGSAILNRAHPLARGLLACWLFNEGSTNLIDLAGIQRASVTDTAQVRWATGAGGVSLLHTNTMNATRSVLISPTLTLASGAAWSWFAHLTWTGATGGYQTLLTQSGVKGIWFRSTGHNDFYAGGDHNDTMAINANETHSYGIAVDAGGATGTHYLDGKANGTFSFTATSFLMDSILNDSNEAFGGNLYCTYIWNRALSAASMFQLAKEPYTFLTLSAPRMWMFKKPSAAAPAATHVDERAIFRGAGRGILRGVGR